MKYLLNLLLVAGLAFLSSCDKAANKEGENTAPHEVRGSIFIATKGGDNIKLGLVDVYALPTDDFNSLASESEKALIESSSSALTSAEEKLREYKTLYPKALEACQTASSLNRQAMAVTAKWQRPFEYTIHVDARIISPSSSERDTGRPQVVLEEFNTVERKNQQNWAENRKHVSDYSACKDDLQKTVTMFSSLFSDRSLNRNVIALVEKSTKVESKATSDADGKFTLKLDPSRNYYIVAKAQRAVGDSTERYEWLFELSAAQIASDSELFLSNNTLSNSYKEIQPVFAGLRERINKLEIKDQEIVSTHFFRAGSAPRLYKIK